MGGWHGAMSCPPTNRRTGNSRNQLLKTLIKIGQRMVWIAAPLQALSASQVPTFAEQYPEFVAALEVKEQALLRDLQMDYHVDIATRWGSFSTEELLLTEPATTSAQCQHWRRGEHERLEVYWPTSELEGAEMFEWLAFSPDRGGTCLRGYPSMPTSYSYSVCRRRGDTRVSRLNPLYFGLLVKGVPLSECLKRYQLLECELSSVATQEFRLILSAGRMDTSGVPISPKLIELTCEFASLLGFSRARVFDSSAAHVKLFGTNESIEVSGTKYFLANEWLTLSWDRIGAFELPTEGRYTTYYTDYSNPLHRGVGINHVRLKNNGYRIGQGTAASASYYISPPLGSTIRDDDLGVTLPLEAVSESQVLGVTPNQLRRLISLLEFDKNPGELPEYSYVDVKQDFASAHSVNCAVLAAHLLTTALSAPVSIETLAGRIAIDQFGSSTMEDLKRAIEIDGPRLSAVRFSGEKLLTLDSPAVVFFRPRVTGAPGHFAVLAPVQGETLVFSPPYEPYPLAAAEGFDVTEQFIILVESASLTDYRTLLLWLSGLGLLALIGWIAWRANSGVALMLLLFVPLGCARSPSADAEHSEHLRLEEGVLLPTDSAVHTREDIPMGVAVEETFRLSNLTNETVLVTRTESSCSCLFVELSTEEVLAGTELEVVLAMKPVRPNDGANCRLYGLIGTDDKEQLLATVELRTIAFGDAIKYSPAELRLTPQRRSARTTLTWVSTQGPPPDTIEFDLPDWAMLAAVELGPPVLENAVWYRNYFIDIRAGELSSIDLPAEDAGGEIRLSSADVVLQNRAIILWAPSDSQAIPVFLGPISPGQTIDYHIGALPAASSIEGVSTNSIAAQVTSESVLTFTVSTGATQPGPKLDHMRIVSNSGAVMELAVSYILLIDE